ncbi:MAG: response regulator [Deltaproteobacteria bacterium]|jgi:DNA-binding NtrC family response regulator|nr:response regulator [Deltaproteobacteria bacterium]
MEEAIRILLVDDESEATDLLSKRLTRRGCICRCAHSGEQALELLKEERPNVIVLDVKMPGMGGLSALEKIKSLYPEIEIIMLSGHADPDSAVIGLRLGAFGYVMKPPNFNDLWHLIEDASHLSVLNSEQGEGK